MILLLIFIQNIIYQAKMPAAILAKEGDCVTILPELLKHSLTPASYAVPALQLVHTRFCKLKSVFGAAHATHTIPSK
jgi:hypothetical protein